MYHDDALGPFSHFDHPKLHKIKSILTATITMNSLFDRNDATTNQFDVRLADTPTTWDNDERDVWMPKPSLHALWAPPMNNQFNNDDDGDCSPFSQAKSTCSNDLPYDSSIPFGGDPLPNLFPFEKPPRAQTPDTASDDRVVGVPMTIVVPSSPSLVTPVTDKTVVDIAIAASSDQDDDDDDCSSVGMGTVAEEGEEGEGQQSRKRPLAIDDSFMARPNKKRIKCSESQHESSSIVSSPKDLDWNGSLSFLDGMAEHAWVVEEQATSPNHDPCEIDDNTTVGTFDVTTTSARTFTMATFQQEDDDDTAQVSHDNDSSTCSSSFCSKKFQVVEAGTSLVPTTAWTTNVWDGTLTFLDSFPSKKNASLCDFLDAEAQAGIMIHSKYDFFVPPTFMYSQ